MGESPWKPCSLTGWVLRDSETAGQAEGGKQLAGCGAAGGEVPEGEQCFTTSVPKPQTQKGACSRVHAHTHTCAHTHSLLELPRTSFSSVMTCSKQPYLIPRKRAPATALAYSSMAFKHILSFLSSTLAQDEGHCPGGSLPALFASLSPRFFEACPWSIWAAQPCPPGESRSCRERQNLREGTGHGL